jgi:cbb3-type cytochrome oxidase maturation protein
MDILYLLIPFSVLLVFALMALFGWALQANQFDDLEREGERILADGDAGLDADQPPT